MGANDYRRVLWFRVVIASVDWTVWLVDQEHEPLMAAHAGSTTDRSTHGYYDAERCEILISWRLPMKAAWATLFHEMCGHATVNQHGVQFTLEEELHGADLEEKIVLPLTAAQFDSLHRNGLLWFPPRPPTPGDPNGDPGWKDYVRPQAARPAARTTRKA